MNTDIWNWRAPYWAALAKLSQTWWITSMSAWKSTEYGGICLNTILAIHLTSSFWSFHRKNFFALFNFYQPHLFMQSKKKRFFPYMSFFMLICEKLKLTVPLVPLPSGLILVESRMKFWSKFSGGYIVS